VKSEPIDLEKYRMKQEKIRELECIEQEAMERRNQPMQRKSIAFLRHTNDEAAEPVAIHSQQNKFDNKLKRKREITDRESLRIQREQSKKIYELL
jgi:hypothetical protein